VPKVVYVARDEPDLAALEEVLRRRRRGGVVVYGAVEPGSLRAVACLWVEDPTTLAGRSSLPCYVVDERVQIDGALGPGAVVQVSLVRRLPTISHDQFTAHWSTVHAPLARRHHPALVRYVQNVVTAPDLDGIAELGFAREADLHERRYDSPQGRAVIGHDVAGFVDLTAGERLVARWPFTGVTVR